MQIVTPQQLVSLAQTTSLSHFQRIEIEGLVTGAWVCPDIILAEDWIDEITGFEGRPEPIMRGISEQDLTLTVHATFIKVTSALENIDSYNPIFVQQPSSALIWAYGFMRAVRLRPHSFGLFEEPQSLQKSWRGMKRFMAATTNQLSDEERKKAVEDAYHHSGEWIRTLMAWSLDYRKKPKRRARKGSFAA